MSASIVNRGGTLVTESFRVEGSCEVIGSFKSPALDRLEELIVSLQQTILDMQSQMTRLANVVEQCYLAPGMPGAPTDFSCK